MMEMPMMVSDHYQDRAVVDYRFTTTKKVK